MTLLRPAPIRRLVLGVAAFVLGGCGGDSSDLTFLAEGTGHTSAQLPELYEGLPLDRWLARIDDGGPSDRAAALFALGELPGAAAHVDRIAKCLDDASPRVRWGALETLGRLGKSAGGHAEAVLARLRDPSPGVRRAAVLCAGRLGEAAALPLASRLLSPLDEDVRDGVKAALLALGPDAGPAIPSLAKAAGDEADLVLAEHAADVLVSIGEASVPALAQLLGAAGGLAPVTAATALGRLGPAAAPTVPALVTLVVRRKGDARRAALDALAGIGAAALEPVRAALASVRAEDEGLRLDLEELLTRLVRR